MQSGDSKPMARLSVWLLSGDISDTLEATNARLLQEADLSRLKPFQREHFDVYTRHTSPYISYVKGMSLGADFLKQELQQPDVFGYEPLLEDGCTRAGRAFVNSHLVKEGVTGFDGKVSLAGIVPGRYFLHAFTHLGDEHLVWSVPVEVVAGAQQVMLENANLTYPK